MTDKQKTVLLAEDDINISTLLVELLTDEGFKVTCTNDGRKALENIQKTGFDLVLLDEMLPSMLGSEILVRIRSNQATCNTPVIMLTSLKDDSHQASVLKEGADDYIQKPVRFNILLARIDKVLKKSGINKLIEIEVPKDANPQALTPKEKEVLILLVSGYDNSTIANRLVISENTVSNHIKSIQSKLKANNRVHAAILALKLNLV